jgi:predicted DNA-binding transcriptional regulator YafY
MSKRDYITRFLLIVKKLRSARYATFKEINDYVQREFELLDGPKSICLRTFQRDINEIRTIFNIDIQCNSLNQYYIAEEENSGFNNRMLEAFDIINSLRYGQQLAPHVMLEKRCSLGTEHLYGLLKAIRNKFVTRFSYQKYYKTGITSREVEPYALKESKGRWYLLAKDSGDNMIKTFGLDRMNGLDITGKKFVYPVDLNPKNYFENCFGVYVPEDSEPEEIILSFEPLQGKYVKSYPLHESQEILQDNENELLIKLTVYITHDLLMELLSFGDTVKVIQPASLITDIKSSYQDALNLY